jgi:hypothetical protein
MHFAESLLGLLLGVPFIPGIKLDGGLADLAHLAVLAEDIFYKSDDEARHSLLRS